jgi:photosystem II stability/assembly factor-like uncharacterized protein
MMQKIRCAVALLALAAGGCKTTDTPPVLTPPAGTVLDNGSVRLDVVATTVPPGVRAMQFADAMAGVVATAYGKIYQTRDGGGTWALRYTNPSAGQPWRQVLFTDASVGYAVGGSVACLGPNCAAPRGRIVKTTDGGATWTSILQTSDAEIVSIAATGAGSLFAVANTATARILCSTDAGSTWTTVATQPFQLTKIAFDRTLGFCASAAGKIVRSTDSGATWAVAATFGYPYLNELGFATGVGYCVEGYGKVYRTTDDGSSWVLTSNTSFSSLAVQALTPSSCLIFGAGQYSGGDFGTYNGSIKQTKDAGRSWAESVLPGVGPVQCAGFYAPTAGFAIADTKLLQVTVY